MKPLLKVEMKNLPLSIPAAWMDFFDGHAQTLGVSRNAVFRLALKFGGPVLQRLCDVAKDRLRESLQSPTWASEIVDTPALHPLRVTIATDERRQRNSTDGRGLTEKPRGSQKISRGPGSEKARAGRHTGKGNPGDPGDPSASGNQRGKRA